MGKREKWQNTDLGYKKSNPKSDEWNMFATQNMWGVIYQNTSQMSGTYLLEGVGK